MFKTISVSVCMFGVFLVFSSASQTDAAASPLGGLLGGILTNVTNGIGQTINGTGAALSGLFEGTNSRLCVNLSAPGNLVVNLLNQIVFKAFIRGNETAVVSLIQQLTTIVANLPAEVVKELVVLLNDTTIGLDNVLTSLITDLTTFQGFIQLLFQREGISNALVALIEALKNILKTIQDNDDLFTLTPN